MWWAIAFYYCSYTRSHLHFLRVSIFKELLELLCKIFQLLINFFAGNYSLRTLWGALHCVDCERWGCKLFSTSGNVYCTQSGPRQGQCLIPLCSLVSFYFSSEARYVVLASSFLHDWAFLALKGLHRNNVHNNNIFSVEPGLWN